MQKVGTVALKGMSRKFAIVYYSESSFERFDVIDSIKNYNIIDTSNCLASYIQGKGEMFLGDEDVIRSVIRIKRDASVINAKLSKETTFEDGKLLIKMSKDNENLGIHWRCTLEFSRVSYEAYETPEGIIEFHAVNEVSIADVTPINIMGYVIKSAIKSSDIVLGTSAEYYSLDYLKSRYPLEHMESYDIVVADSMETGIRRLKEWADAPTKVKAIDVETTGFGWDMMGEDVMVGLSIAQDENTSTYFGFRQEKFKYNFPMSFLQVILDTVNSQPEDVMIIGHNAKVELQTVWKEDVHYVKNSSYARDWDKDWVKHALRDPELRIDGDSILLSILCNPVFYNGAHELKTLAAKIRKVFFLSLKDIFIDKRHIKFNVLPEELVKYYACMDTPNTISVWNYYIDKLPKNERGILKVENNIIECTAEMEFYGMRTHTERLLQAISNEQYNYDLLANIFKAYHNTSENINSSVVLQNIIYNRMRCPVSVWTKTGAPSTSKSAVKAILDKGRLRDYDKENMPNSIVGKDGAVLIEGKDLASNQYPSLIVLQRYNLSKKELGALKRINSRSMGGRVKFKLNQAGAATGRFTSDAHQYSDAMKKVILADSDDYHLWSSDFKQEELRILAYEAGQQNLIELSSDPDVDVHRAILSILHDKPIWAISADERKRGKSTNFGVVYKMSGKGLAQKDKGADATEEDIIEADKSINGFYNGFPAIKRRMVEREEELREKGYVVTKFGRYRYFPNILDPALDKSSASGIVRAANNFPIQGFAADYLKIVLGNVRDYIREKGWDKKIEVNGMYLPMVRMMLPVHDEILLSSHKSIPIEEIIKMFKFCMEMKIEGAPPLFSAPALVNCWYDGKLDKYEIDLRFRDKVIDEWERGRRILYSVSYSDDIDYRQAGDIDRRCTEIRDEVLRGRQVRDMSTSDFNKALSMLSPEETDLFRRHFIRCDEEYADMDTEMMTVAERMLDADFSFYLKDLSDFRDKRLRDYMDGLIQKYKTIDEVATHVQHPELTHTLIAIMIKKSEKFEHTDAIRESVKRYMEGHRKEGADCIERTDDYADRKYADEIVFVDEKYVDLAGDEIEASDNDESDDEEELQGKEKYKLAESTGRSYCIYTLYEVIIDLSDFDNFPDLAERANQAVAELSKPTGDYNVVYFTKGRMLQSYLKIDYQVKDIDLIIEGLKLEQQEISCMCS